MSRKGFVLAIILLVSSLAFAVDAAHHRDGHDGGESAAGDHPSDEGRDQRRTLPENLEMDDAEVVSYSDTTVVWRWHEVADLGCCNLVGTSTAFDLPADMPVAVQAEVQWGNHAYTLLDVLVEDATGSAVCEGVNATDFTSPRVSCAGLVKSAPGDPRGEVHVGTRLVSNADGQEFTVFLTLTIGPQDVVPARSSLGKGPTMPRVVVGVADSGINPYHAAFQVDSPEAYRHPSTYLDGFPADTPALELTLDADTYVEAIAADADVWTSVVPGQLYWIPGTRIVGAIMPDAGVLDELPEWFCRPVLDCQGHGTATASRAVGQGYSLCSDCKLVAVQGFRDGFDWIAGQPWIDVSSNSWFHDFEDGVGQRNAIDASAARKATFFAAGNGFESGLGPGRPALLWTGPGTPSAITVGGHDNGRYTHWAGSMPQVVADACPLVASHIDMAATQERCGTSAAAPYAAGLGANLILEARSLLGHTDVGVEDGVLARGPTEAVASGPASDGDLTIPELKRMIFTTADPRPGESRHDGQPCEPDITTGDCIGIHSPGLVVQWKHVPPGVPLYYFIGYGGVNADTADHAVAVLAGQAPMPERPVEDVFFAADRSVRTTLMEVDQ